MSAISNGGYAFPTDWGNGMTLRDWFAGQALPAVIAMATSVALEAQKANGTFNESLFHENEWVGTAYSIADKMILEREKK